VLKTYVILNMVSTCVQTLCKPEYEEVLQKLNGSRAHIYLETRYCHHT